MTLSLLGCASSPAPTTPTARPLPAASASAVATPNAEALAADPAPISTESADKVKRAAPREAASSALAPFVVGPATFYVGSRPPWSEGLSAPPLAAPAPHPWRLEKTISVGKGYLYKAEFSRDLQSVFVLSQQDGVFRQYQVSTGQLLQGVQLPAFTEFDAVDFAPHTANSVFIIRDKGLYTLNLTTGEIVALDLEGGDAIDELARPGLFALSHRRVDPQSGTVTLAWMDGEVPVEALRIVSAERPDGIALSSEGRFLALNVYPSNVVYLVDLMARRIVHTFKPPQWGSSVAFSPDGRWLALGGAELYVHDTATGALVVRDSNYGNNIGKVRFSPQGDLLLTAAFDGRARSYAFGSAPPGQLGPPQALRHRGTANVYGLGLSPDGRKLATSSGDTTIKVWTR